MTAAIRRVRAVVVTYNNASFVSATLEALAATRWEGTLETVVVDNASVDGTADLVARRFPNVRLLRNGTNWGFAGGANVGMGDLDGVDAVALVNSDAGVAEDWLEPLAATLDADHSLGAACPKILLDTPFVEVRLGAPLNRPANGDPRMLGVRVLDEDGRTQYPQGFSAAERGGRWTNAEQATLWLPADAYGVMLIADRPKSAFVQGLPADVGPESSWHAVAAAEPFDVINNVGNELTADWYGRDRGWLQRDRGQYDEPEDVWGWSGGAALLRADYLHQVGRFDESLFMYYEDIDLAWRGRKAGWRYRFVPTSVVRHAHAASSGGEASALFDHLNQRNRLVVLSRHAPTSVAAKAWARYTAEVGRSAWGEIARPLLERRRPHPNTTSRRLRAGVGALRRWRRENHALGHSRADSSRGAELE